MALKSEVLKILNMKKGSQSTLSGTPKSFLKQITSTDEFLTRLALCKINIEFIQTPVKLSNR